MTILNKVTQCLYKKSVMFVSLLLLLSACFPSNDQARKEYLLQGFTMGTTYNIKIIGQDVDTQILQPEIDRLLQEVNQQMSTYIKDSELSTFNQSLSTQPVEISASLARVIQEALRLGKMSDGLLDVTVGPLVNLWGFGPDKRPNKIPNAEILHTVQSRIGLDKITLKNGFLQKSQADVYIDLSTIAKGYAVDLVAEYLERQHLDNYLVEIGGEMRLKGFKHTGELWHIAIEKPVTNERTVHQIVVPKNNAVATSGDYRNYYELNGQRFSHIINPITGKPINHKLVSVTVIHPSSMTADGLATALMVMGEEKALAFAQQYDLAVYLIVKTDRGFVEQSTVKFMQYLK